MRRRLRGHPDRPVIGREGQCVRGNPLGVPRPRDRVAIDAGHPLLRHLPHELEVLVHERSGLVAGAARQHRASPGLFQRVEVHAAEQRVLGPIRFRMGRAIPLVRDVGVARAAARGRLQVDVGPEERGRRIAGRAPREEREERGLEDSGRSDGSQDAPMVSRSSRTGQGTRPCRSTSAAMVPRIFEPAWTEPFHVPEIFERPTRFR